MSFARFATATLLLALSAFVLVATWHKAEDAWQKRQIRKGNSPDCCHPKQECCP